MHSKSSLLERVTIKFIFWDLWWLSLLTGGRNVNAEDVICMDWIRYGDNSGWRSKSSCPKINFKFSVMGLWC